MTAAATSGRNPFWPYDLTRQPGEPSPLTHLDWDQHARVAPSLPTAVRTATWRPIPGGDTMQATVTAALDATALAPLLTVLQDSDVVLGAFTEEELAAVDPPDDDSLVPLTVLDAVTEEADRDQLLAAAVRSLLARGLVELGDEPGEFAAAGALATVLTLRGAPNSILVVEHVEEDAPARSVVYGLHVPTTTGDELLLMEESVALLGHHEFVLRSVDGQGAALAEWLGSATDAGNAGAGSLDAALAAPTAMTRLYALRRDDEGADPEGGQFSELELTIVDGGPHGRWMVLFQPGAAEGDREGILAVPVAKLDLPAFFAALLRLDLGPFNDALAAG